MLAPIAIHPNETEGRESIHSLPYEALRVDPVCQHSLLYFLQIDESGPLLCGLCFFKEGYESELPGRIHQFKVLADNGNPQTAPMLMAHLQVSMGLKPPKPGQDLRDFRRQRNALAREQYTVRGPQKFGSKLSTHSRNVRFSSTSRLYPVASALWKLMGYQPPLGIVLVRGVTGRTEEEIAAELNVTRFNVNIRMTKAIRTAVGYLPDASV